MQPMKQPELLPHLFRNEFSKIVSVLIKKFGFIHIETAEDIASDTFLAAYENWSYKGIPENPSAWLYFVAKNKAKNYLQRQSYFAENSAQKISQSVAENFETDIDLSEQNITDSLLQMLFAVCHPSISVESQIGLALRILCGFGIDEIATALLTNKETVNKRLFRAKEKLRAEKIRIELPEKTEIENRLDSVLTTLYLLFNEGYYSESDDSVIRRDLCSEAMRLTHLLIGNQSTDLPKVNALFSLMCFQSSRFDARKNKNGELILYDDQDESLWNAELISQGAYYLNKASNGNQLSKFHLEAGIAYWYTIKQDSKEKWENILQLFNRLLQTEYSPIAALNRTYALSKTKGKQEAIIEAEKLKLENNHFYFALLGELYSGVDNMKSKENFEQAMTMAKTEPEKKMIQKKLRNLF